MQSADLGGGGNVYYQYDAGGERIRKVIINGNIRDERIYQGGVWEIYRKTVNSVLDTERSSVHISDDTGRVCMIDSLLVDGGSIVSSPTLQYRYLLSNHLGSSSIELDEAAALISYEEYYPFGSSSYRSGRNAAETSLKRYRYVDKERDDETGLYYYGARYYASWLARFVSVDPLKDQYPQLNPYNYADNNPVSDKDIDGRQNFNSEVRPRGQTQPSDATTHVAGRDARLRFENRNLPVTAYENQVGAFFLELAKIGAGILDQIGSSQSFEGFKGPSAKPNPEKVEQEIQRYKDLPKLLDPKVHIESFSETVVTGTFNLVEGIVEGDGKKLARAVPFVAEVAGTIYGLKSPSTSFTKLNLRTGSDIPEDLLFRGSTRGFEGNSATQRLGITPTTSDPAVATLYAIQSSKFGEGVLFIAKKSDLEGIKLYPGNLKMDLETGVELSPLELANRSSIITLDQAKSILQKKDVNLPRQVNDFRDLNSFIEEIGGNLTEAQIQEFYQQAQKFINN